MAYQVSKVTVPIKLDNGTDTEGNQRTVTINLGDMNESTFDPTDSTDQTALLAIITAMEPVLDKEVYAIQVQTTAKITAA